MDQDIFHPLLGTRIPPTVSYVQQDFTALWLRLRRRLIVPMDTIVLLAHLIFLCSVMKGISVLKAVRPHKDALQEHTNPLWAGIAARRVRQGHIVPNRQVIHLLVQLVTSVLKEPHTGNSSLVPWAHTTMSLVKQM